MKLIFVNRYFHPDISATSQLATDLALDQAARGREVHVVASRQLYDDAAACLGAAQTHRGVRIHRVWTTRFGRAGLAGRAIDYATFCLACAAALLRLAAAGDLIVAKTDPPLVGVVAAWVARRRRAILVNWLQDVFPEAAQRLGVTALSGALGAFARRLRDYSLRSAAANVAVGDRMAGTIGALAHSGARVEVIENWADGSLVRPIARAANRLRAEWGLGDRFVVGYSGNMGRAHEFVTILEACERLRSEPGIVFLFVGSGHQRGWLESEALRRSLGNVVFRPYQPRAALAESLCAADAHLVSLKPALEGLIVPSKFYAIAAAARPTLFIGDPDGEIARVVAGEGCGRTLASGDGAGLAAAIRALRDRPQECAQMGERARAAFERRFDAPLALAKWDRLLAGLA